MKKCRTLEIVEEGKWWPETESNCRHEDFQSSALPTELSGQGDLERLKLLLNEARIKAM